MEQAELQLVWFFFHPSLQVLIPWEFMKPSDLVTGFRCTNSSVRYLSPSHKYSCNIQGWLEFVNSPMQIQHCRRICLALFQMQFKKNGFCEFLKSWINDMYMQMWTTLWLCLNIPCKQCNRSSEVLTSAGPSTVEDVRRGIWNTPNSPSDLQVKSKHQKYKKLMVQSNFV